MAKAKKEQLGRGLASLLGNIEKEVSENPQRVVKELTMNFAMVPIDSIERYTGQPRTEFDEALIVELSESIRVHGVIQPLTVRMLSQTEQKYQLISGERRWRAARLAGLMEVPAYIRIANDQEMLEMALVENIQRADLNPIEIAITYQRLIDECNLTHEVLAERVAKSRPAISNALRLLRLPPAIQQAIKLGKVTTGHAKVLAGAICGSAKPCHRISLPPLAAKADRSGLVASIAGWRARKASSVEVVNSRPASFIL